MPLRSPRPILAALLGLLLLLCVSACTVPLAPGYKILKESREVRFVPGTPPSLHIRASYVLQNSGNSQLAFIDVIFPDEKLYGRKNLRVEMGGREITPVKLPEEYQQESPNALRIPLDPAWEQKQTRALNIEFSFISPEDPGARITLGADNFHLSSHGWISLPQSPKRVLAPYPERPPKTIYTVRVPDSFLILARGREAGRKKDGGEIEYRFELRKDDLSPFIVAGRYVDSSAKRKSPASFWTLQPLRDDPATAGERIASAWATLLKDFGPLGKNISVPHIVESPELRAPGDRENPNAAASFPGGALVSPGALALGLQSDEFLQEAEQALARSWFGDQMYPVPDAAVGIGQGLPNYATIVIDQASGGESARRQRIVKYLQAYDEAVKKAAGTPNAEKSIVTTMAYDPPEQRRIAAIKAALFFVALEDAFGEALIRSGLGQVVALLQGKEVGYDDLRSALEQSTGKKLAEPFRVWLFNKGIPQQFRDQYGVASPAENQ